MQPYNGNQFEINCIINYKICKEMVSKYKLIAVSIINLGWERAVLHWIRLYMSAENFTRHIPETGPWLSVSGTVLRAEIRISAQTQSCLWYWLLFKFYYIHPQVLKINLPKIIPGRFQHKLFLLTHSCVESSKAYSAFQINEGAELFSEVY